MPPADDRNTNTSTIKSEGDDRKSFDPFKPSAGRSTSRRSYKSPLERSFCNLINRDTRYDVCVVDCKSNWNGGVQGCTETVWEKKCGCNEGPPKVVGVMKYKVSTMNIFVSHLLQLFVISICNVWKYYFLFTSLRMDD